MPTAVYLANRRPFRERMHPNIIAMNGFAPVRTMGEQSNGRICIVPE
jgi:hypothetical protein